MGAIKFHYSLFVIHDSKIPMLGYLEKFNKLPSAVRRRASDARALTLIEALEKKYKVALAVLIMKTMVGELTLNNLAENLLKENLSKAQAGELAKELKDKLFFLFPSTSLRTEKNYLAAGAAKPAALTAAPQDGQAKAKSANFFFSPEDEEEIRQLTKKIVMAENSVQARVAIDEKLEEIISRAKINFGSVNLADRFSQILRTYLRGIRNKLDVKATLMKPFLNGGLSFDEDSAEKVMALADKVLRSAPSQPFKPAPKIKLPEPAKYGFAPKPEISRDAAYDFSKLAAARDDKIKNDLKKLDTAHELAPAKIPPTPAAPVSRPLIKRRFEAENSSQTQKVKIEDVKYVPRVMGPLDELKYLDLTSFRRLDRDQFSAAAKIKNKIDLLAEENYGKKFEGIKQWRLSPVNKLYLEIGHLSISENKPIDVIMKERKMAGSDYLTADEFKAIMDLNKSLRF